MEDKKAMLLTEEVLKIVIALVGLALLAYFLISFFTSDTKTKNQRDAAETIDRIYKSLSDVSSSGIEVDALQPQRWILFGFVGNEEKPNQCSNQNCACICKKVIGNVFDRQIKKCSKEGSCVVIPTLIDFEDIKIETYRQGTTSINIQEVNGEIQISKI